LDELRTKMKERGLTEEILEKILKDEWALCIWYK
jgi:hypothetical protein